MTLCPLESWCFSLLRRRNDSSIQIKRGCATSCMSVFRRRTVKKCCGTSLCNSELPASGFPELYNNTVIGERTNNISRLSAIHAPPLSSQIPTAPQATAAILSSNHSTTPTQETTGPLSVNSECEQLVVTGGQLLAYAGTNLLFSILGSGKLEMKIKCCSIIRTVLMKAFLEGSN